MKKTILYLFAAVLLGLLITIVPVITLARVTTTPITNGHQTSFGKSLKQLEGGEGTPNSIISNSQVTALAICFIIAMVAYAIIGPKAPRRYNMRLGVPPY